MKSAQTLRVLAFMEGLTVTGPAKNLISFATAARSPQDGLPGIDLQVGVYVRGAPSEPNPFLRALQNAGIPVHVISEKSAGDWNAISQLRSIVERANPDIVQSHHCKSHFFVRLSGCWKTTPWIGFHHGYTATAFRTRIYNQFDRFSLHAARRIVTVCGPFSRELQRYGIPEQRITVLHNSVKEFVRPDEDSIRRVREQYSLADANPVILVIGRLSREKGHSDLIEAVALLRRHSPALAFRVAIVGDGPEREPLVQQIAQAGLSGYVILCGQHGDVRPFYALATLLALPSHSEGSPNVLLEAMAAGVPAVATRVGGVPEIATDGETARLIPRQDPQSMANALEELLTHPEKARDLACAAHQQVLAQFTSTTYRRALVNIYQSVRNSGR